MPRALTRTAVVALALAADASAGDSNEPRTAPSRDARCLVVVADYDDRAARKKMIYDRVDQFDDCHVHIMEKGEVSCAVAVPATWRARASCERLPNVGDELHSIAHFVAARYDALPPVLIFAPCSLRWDRREKLDGMLLRRYWTSETFECPSMRRGTLAGEQGYSVDHYSKRSSRTKNMPTTARAKNFRHRNKRLTGHLTPAEPRPLGRWLKAHTDLDKRDLAVDVCAHGNFRTTRERLRERPREMYANITRQLAVPHPEAGHYMERAVGAVFAGRQPWKPRLATRAKETTGEKSKDR